jgi:hypothetical protein|tara:strand:- start:275 stop:448 length:174 start_codon:yes stop_codon:yes gene_type:complete
MKTYVLESFGEIVEFAESLGWVDTYDDWSPSIANAIEEEAVSFIESKGYTIKEGEVE